MKGSLIYVMGPSGAGKDSLIGIAKKSFESNPDITFVRRCITRDAALGGEDFTAVGEEKFEALEADNYFLFTWRSHGLSYGCPKMIEWQLAAGKVVVLNGSRAYLKKAKEIIPDLTPLLITATPEVLAARLKDRARETAAEQTERLTQPVYEAENIHTLDNSGPLEIAAGQFVAFLDSAVKRL